MNNDMIDVKCWVGTLQKNSIVGYVRVDANIMHDESPYVDFQEIREWFPEGNENALPEIDPLKTIRAEKMGYANILFGSESDFQKATGQTPKDAESLRKLKELEDVPGSPVTVKESRHVVATLLMNFPDMDIALIRERSFVLINYIGQVRTSDFGEVANRLNKERVRKVMAKNLLPRFIPHGKGHYSLDFTEVDESDK